MKTTKIICAVLIGCNLAGCATCVKTENTSKAGQKGVSSTSVWQEESCESSNTVASTVAKGIMVLIPIVAFGSFLSKAK